METKFKQWIESILGLDNLYLAPILGDASPRQYYRIHLTDQSYIAMLALGDHADVGPFLKIAQVWGQAGLEVPKIIAADQAQGFILLSDFGDDLLLQKLNQHNVDQYYSKALEQLELLRVQKSSTDYTYPYFDKTFIEMELNIFNQWCLDKLLGLDWQNEKNVLSTVYEQLVHYCATQPQVVIHRDYHSRNIMVLKNQQLGIIDFQDAMIGPITYDWVSLTKDCYIEWPETKVQSFLEQYYRSCQAHQVSLPSFSVFQLWFDMVGLQRHLKVMGVFSRLYLRDHKPAYLAAMPRIMTYISQMADRYSELKELNAWLSTVVWPALEEVTQMMTNPMQKGA